MELFLLFLAHQWMLVGAFLALVLLYAYNELRRGGAIVTPQQLAHRVNREDAVVIDLREAAEFRNGHIAGAINIPAKQLPERHADLKQYGERPLILVCAHGQQASAAGRALQQAGFANIHRLPGGLREWEGARLPLVKE